MSNHVEPTHYDDQEFVTRCQSGEVEAFGVLVERHQKRMFNIALRMTGDYEEAAEVVQEAFLSAFRAIRKFRGEASFATWLTGIVLNHSRNRLKQLKTRAHHVPLSLDDAREDHEGTPRCDPPSGGPSALEQVEKKALQEAVQEAINALDEEAREVLILRDIQECSYEEIAATLKIPDGTVKSRIFRAREALKGKLKKRLGDL
jgi:RNA polymerase sigma-70 factor, ECF subfamily